MDLIDDSVNALNSLHLLMVSTMPFVIAAIVSFKEETLPSALFLALIILMDFTSLLTLIYTRRCGLFKPKLVLGSQTAAVTGDPTWTAVRPDPALDAASAPVQASEGGSEEVLASVALDTRLGSVSSIGGGEADSAARITRH